MTIKRTYAGLIAVLRPTALAHHSSQPMIRRQATINRPRCFLLLRNSRVIHQSLLLESPLIHFNHSFSGFWSRESIRGPKNQAATPEKLHATIDVSFIKNWNNERQFFFSPLLFGVKINQKT